MAGKHCTGSNEYSGAFIQNSRAYCEGRALNASGGLVGADPHPANSDASVAWLAGFASWEEDPATAPSRDCCDIAFGGGYVAP